MGTDISGFIEVLTADWDSDDSREHWLPTVPLELLYDNRDYDLFACLFGVRNFAGFTPVAADRGLPDDASDRVRSEYATYGGHSASWLTWAEAAAVDWSEPAARPDARVHEYRRAEDGTLTPVGKSGWSKRFETLIGSSRRPGDPPGGFPVGSEWIDGDTVFRVERLRRSDVVGAAWRRVWTVMEALSAVSGAENVRLVVWFDS